MFLILSFANRQISECLFATKEIKREWIIGRINVKSTQDGYNESKNMTFWN